MTRRQPSLTSQPKLEGNPPAAHPALCVQLTTLPVSPCEIPYIKLALITQHLNQPMAISNLPAMQLQCPAIPKPLMTNTVNFLISCRGVEVPDLYDNAIFN